MSDATQSEAFRSPEREAAADAFGMWLFIASEAMLFGALLLLYLIARLSYPEVFAAASGHLSLTLATLNTGVLLTSSYTIAVSDAFCREERWRGAAVALIATLALGFVFLGIKGFEYWKEYEEGLAPVLGAPFSYGGPRPDHAELFFNIYFVMTSLHAAHLFAGLVVIAWLLASWRRADMASRQRKVHATGLYWHFVDIVWIFLYPILYLVDR